MRENSLLVPITSSKYWYSKLVKAVVITRFYVKLQLLPAIRQDSGEFLLEQDCHSPQNRLVYDINISQSSVATRLRCGGIFSDSSCANFLKSVPVKEFLENRSTPDEVLTKTRWRTFLSHGV